MSTVFIVKCEAKSKIELKKALQAAINEISGDEVVSGPSTHSVKLTKTEVEVEEMEEMEEMEEVESPYKETTTEPARQILNAPVYTNATIDNELDTEGLPWDDRIHASSKAKVKSGAWREKRGAEEDFIRTIKAELRARVQASKPAAPVVAPVVEAPVVHLQPAAPVVAPVVEAPVVAPVVEAPVVAPAMPSMGHGGHTLDTFKANFPFIIANLITEKKIDQAYINSLIQFFKINYIYEANDEQKAMVFDQFVEYKFINKVG